jgi:hypothetical protein
VNTDEEKLTKDNDKVPDAATFGGVQTWEVGNGAVHKKVYVRVSGDGIVDVNIGLRSLREDC